LSKQGTKIKEVSILILKDLVKLTLVKKMKFHIFEHRLFNPKNITSLNKLGGGIYRMYDKTGKVIYVGKSKDVHRRILQHIGKDTNTAYFIEEVDLIEWYQENNPIFQTLLEAIFIAYHKPKYNDEVKDWKQMEDFSNSILRGDHQ
jgi:DNA polymerase III subunit epsilon